MSNPLTWPVLCSLIRVARKQLISTSSNAHKAQQNKMKRLKAYGGHIKEKGPLKAWIICKLATAMLRHHPSHYKYPVDLTLGHLGHYEDVEHLISELEQEKRHRDSIVWSNTELERSVSELETYYRELGADRRDADDNEWKVRFEQQGELNKQLSETREWLEAELVEVRRRLTTGSYPEANKYNLDVLNEPELLRLVKHLERTRNGLYSSLRDTEWKMDKESKEFRHLDEIRRTTRADLKHLNHNVERLQWTRIVEPSLSPIYHPSTYPYWLDTPPLGGAAGGSLNRRMARREEEWNKAGASKSPQPIRAKSRAEKKNKKKEAPPPQDEGRRNEGGASETENGTDVFDAGKESNPSSGADTYIKETQSSKQKRKSSKDRANTQE